MLVVVEVVTLGLVAVVALVLLPASVGVETFCVLGESTHTANVYAVAFLVAILLTGLTVAVFVAVLAHRLRRRWPLVPLGWLAAIVLAQMVVASALDPQPCGPFSLF